MITFDDAATAGLASPHFTVTPQFRLVHSELGLVDLSDRLRSFDSGASIDEGQDGKVLLKCHGGCPTQAVVSTLGLTIADLFVTPLNANGRRHDSDVVCAYDYCDADGHVLYQSVRKFPKDFFLRRPDPDRAGAWINTVVGAVRLVPYRLPELRQGVALREKIFLVEGEKDADRLTEAGLYATTNPMGACKWYAEYNTRFAGADVIIAPDNDDSGRKHGDQVAWRCLMPPCCWRRPKPTRPRSMARHSPTR